MVAAAGDGRARRPVPARRRRDRHERASATPSSSISAATAMPARTAPTSSCPAPPTPRNRAPTSTPRAGCRWPSAPAFPPGEAREDWAILRALSDVLGQRLPFDTLAELRAALYAAHPHFMRVDQIAAGFARRRAKRWPARGGHGRQRRRSATPIARFLPDQPDRARLGGDGRMLGARRRQARDGGGVGGRWAAFFQRLRRARRDHGRREPAAAGDAADLRRLPALRRPQDLGGGADAARAERRRPVGPAAELRRPAQVRVQGADHPVRRQQGRVPAGAAGHRRRWRSRPGR